MAGTAPSEATDEKGTVWALGLERVNFAQTPLDFFLWGWDYRDKNKAEYGREKERERQEGCRLLGGSWGGGRKAGFRPHLTPGLIPALK